MEIVLLCIGLAVGALLGWLLGKLRAPKSTDQAATLTAQLAAAQATIEQLQLRVDESARAQNQLVEQHKIEREQREEKTRADASVLEKLAPVSTVINDLKTKVEQMEQARTDQHAEIRTHLRNSFELSNELNKTTQSLSRVMSDSSLRGSWGELQLERVAELSGLHKGVNYTLQKTVEGEDNKGRPDMTVYLSGNAAIAVDAKAPFAAYNEAMSPEATPEHRKAMLTKHAKDLRSHITTLASREYAKNLEGKVDYVICFVPADPILSAALETDQELLEYAISKKVVLTSPTSLVAVLRPVAITWVQVANAQRAGEIVEMGKELYSRLATMAGHAAKLGKDIQSTAGTYNKFVASLESRVLVQARKFDKLDASDLPEFESIDGTVNLFNQQELRGVNAELDAPQAPIGEPVDAEEV